MNVFSSAFQPLLSAPLALRVSAGFALLAVVAAGLPHAFVSCALILAFVALLAAALRTPFPFITANSVERVLLALVLAWLAWVLLRTLLAFAWSEAISWSGVGHGVALIVPFALGFALRAPLARSGGAAILIGVGGVALLAVINHLFPHNTWRLFEGYRVYLGNDSIAIDIMLALLAAGVFLATLAHWLRQRTKPTLVQCGYVLLAMLPLFAFGQSRSALAVFAISVLLGAMVVARSWLQRVFVPAAVLLAVCAAYVASPLARDRVEKAVAEVSAALSAHKVTSSQGQRLALASVSWHALKDRPLAGHGLGAWRTEFAKRVPPQWEAAIGRHTSPHNEYLHIAVQLGLIAALMYAGIWFTLFRLGVTQLRAHASPWLFLIAVVFLVGSITNVMLWDFRFWAPMSALLASALASAGQGQKSPDFRGDNA